MNRSLSFFTDLKTSRNNNDKLGDINEYTENITINVLDSESKNIIETKPLTQKYNLYTSKFNNNTYIDYRGSGTSSNNILPSSSVDNETYDINEVSIIKWSKKYKSVELKALDFAYLKDVNVYPCNRLAILRRFGTAADHDLLNSGLVNASPISTMISYVKPDDTDLMQLSFGEEWITSSDGLLGVINDVIGLSDVKLPTFQGLSNLEQSITINVANALGITPSNVNPLGNPNIIHEAAIRKTGNEFDGLKFDFKYKFETTYLMKFIDDTDPHLAFIDIIANTVRMGTSPSEFFISPAFSSDIKKIMNNIMNGNTTELINSVISGISNFLMKAINEIVGVVKNAITEPISETANKLYNTVTTLIGTTLSKYKWRLMGAVSSMTGVSTAPWHLTLGNPKAPWFTVGNLIMDGNINLNVSKNFTFNDIPDSITVSCNLKNGRRLGGQEIESLFNGGKGRIYHNFNSKTVNKTFEEIKNKN